MAVINGEMVKSDRKRKSKVLCGPDNAPQQFLIAAIGDSAGGLEAYVTFFKLMPADTGIGRQ
jgi:chemotaxis response regulator CheB